MDARVRPVSSSYHHGDLGAALLEAGLDLAREGGPEAVVLREATRRAGVSPNAAYRHFASRTHLLAAVAQAAQGQVADAMAASIEAQERQAGSGRLGLARLRGVGLGYVAFARANPGLFRVAFEQPSDLSKSGDEAAAGHTGRTPFQLLAQALDTMVSDGDLTVERRPGAEFLCWSAVHGFAVLVLGGPLRGIEPAVIDALTGRVVDMALRGVVG